MSCRLGLMLVALGLPVTAPAEIPKGTFAGSDLEKAREEARKSGKGLALLLADSTTKEEKAAKASPKMTVAMMTPQASVDRQWSSNGYRPNKISLCRASITDQQAPLASRQVSTASLLQTALKIAQSNAR